MVDSVVGHGSLIGTRLGEYEVEALIGRGAMGSVYLARDTKLNRLVALKVLLGSLARTPSLVKQFHQEAQAAAPLNHPGIVRIYSAGVESGTPYIAMEFVDGEPLDRFLNRHDRISWNVALHVGSQVAKALDAAHRHGVVHRDVKPSNIMLDGKGNVRLTDFGIASIQSDGDSGNSAGVIGTPQYMSPEQVTGRPTGPASDLFALGVTLYQMMAGEMPFRGESSMALIKSICEDVPPRLNRIDPDIPDDVARLVAYLIEKEPSARPANAKVATGLFRRLQRQRGEASALNESITAFLQEEMEVRPFSGVGGSARSGKQDSSIRKKSQIKKKSKGSIPWAKIAQGSLIAALAIAALAVGPMTSRVARESATQKAPRLEMVSFQRVTPGVTSMSLYTDGYALGPIHWVGDRGVAIVEVLGLAGGLTQGMSGLISVDPAAEAAHSLRPPGGGVNAPSQALQMAGVFGLSMPRIPPDSALADSFLVHTMMDGARPHVTLAQRWDAASPDPRILYQASTAAWSGQARSQWHAKETARAVVSPDGNTLCLVIFEEEQGHVQLVERDLRESPPHRVGASRTTIGANVIPESVQYSPDGNKIAYLRRKENSEAELWLLAANNVERNGHHLVSGVASATFSFSPDGRWIAALVRRRASSAPQVVLLDARLGEVVAEYGPGRVSAEAWHPSSSQFVYAAGVASEDSGPARLQLHRANAEPPYESYQITGVKQGVTDHYSVSRDGTWLAVAALGTKVPTLMFYQWDALSTPSDSSG